MNGALFVHTWRAYRVAAPDRDGRAGVWGAILPIIYDSFGAQFQAMLDSGPIPPQFAQFGGGDIFSLTGSVALGFVHPIAVGLNLVFAVGFARRRWPASGSAGRWRSSCRARCRARSSTRRSRSPARCSSAS